MKKLLALLFAATVTSFSFGQSSLITTGAAKAWVENIAFDKNAMPASGQERSSYYLLLDDQENFNAQEQYAHYVYKILTTEGLQDMADLSFPFDPSYEQLIFHKLAIHRGDSVINKLPKTFKTIQREESMDRYIYDGSLTTVINLSDVRVGDIVEYAYTRKGYNPVHKDHLDRRFYLSYETALLRQRFIVPIGLKVQLRTVNDAPQPTISQQNGNAIYTWRIENPTSVVSESGSPAWYDPSAQAALTSFEDWAAVNRWATKLFTVKEADKKALELAIGKQFKSTDLTAYTQEVIRFVQDEVRYLGFESGLNTHMPYPPLKVFRQRFGDCKDKSLLLTTLLNARGVAAFPVLVNTSLEHTVSELLPSAYAFDHCVVQITLNNKTFYIDPTISNQGGKPDSIYFPRYGKGLVVDGQSEDFVTFGEPELSSTFEKQTFTLDSIGGGATLTVTLTYKGGNADGARAQWSSYSANALQKSHLKFYANQYPDIEIADTIKFKDNRDDNILIVEEYYRIPEFWIAREDNSHILVGTVRALSLETYFSYTKSTNRTDPFSLSYPVDYKTIIQINFPIDWPAGTDNKNIDNDYYTYSLSSYGADKVSYITMHYQTKQSYLPAEAHAQYLKDHETMWNNLSFEFTYNSTIAAANKKFWPGIVLGIFVVCSSLYIAFRIYRDYNPTPYYPAAWAAPLGGWLILVGFGITVSPCLHLYSLIRNPALINGTAWLSHFSAGNHGVALVTLLLQIYNLAYLPFCIVFAILFYKRRSCVPRLMSIYIFTNLVIGIINAALTIYQEGPPIFIAAFTMFMKPVLPALVWIPYFRMSQRVKRTFVFTNAGNSDPDETSDATMPEQATETAEEEDRVIQPGEAIG